VLEPIGLEPEHAEWARLAEASANVFLTQTWLSTWWRHFGTTASRLLLTACRDRDGRLRGVLPIYIWRTAPIRVARLIGHGQADVNGFLCCDADAPAVAASARRLMERERISLFIGDSVDGRVGESLGAKTLSVESSPVLVVPEGGWEGWLASAKGSVRGELRRVLRRIDERPGATFRLADRASVEADLDRLFELHAARWGHETPFERARAFHRDFAMQAQQRGWLRLWTLEFDGSAVATWLGFRFGGVDSYYQSGRDPGWVKERIGKAVLFHSIRDAMECGSSEYRFLRGDEAYKQRYATVDRPTRRIVSSRDLVGRTAAALIPAAKAARNGIRGLSNTARGASTAKEE
jgi:CelD/BcsL family acetyltransferase involved in cellulose biosynthesis